MPEKAFQQRTAWYGKPVNFNINGWMFSTVFILFYPPVLEHIISLLGWELWEQSLACSFLTETGIIPLQLMTLTSHTQRQVGNVIKLSYCESSINIKQNKYWLLYIPGMIVEAGWAMGLRLCCIDSWCNLANCEEEQKKGSTGCRKH